MENYHKIDTNAMAAKIKASRVAKNMTQAELADEMGVSFQSVSNWERGYSRPDIAKLRELCRVLGISVDELLGGERETAPRASVGHRKRKHARPHRAGKKTP